MNLLLSCCHSREHSERIIFCAAKYRPRFLRQNTRFDALFLNPPEKVSFVPENVGNIFRTSVLSN
jgi:hypothetical protein